MKGADIKAFREANNLTQKALADYLGIDKGFISAIEHEKSKLPKAKLSLLLNNPHNWDTSMLTPKSKYIVADGLLEGVGLAREKSAEEFLVSYLQEKIADQDRLIRELYKEIGMLQAKLDLARKGETASGAAGSSCADVG